MAELQSLDKPAVITTCAHLAEHFSEQFLNKYGDSDELHLVFDRYDVPLSLKSATRITDSTHIVVVAWGNNCQATHRDVTHLRSSQEEADTKMILHAVDAASHGATEINIHSPDTDVFILSLRRYPQLCNDVHFVTGTRQRHRVIKKQMKRPSLP